MSFKSKVSAALRWAWFGLLVLLAFGYLASGLSDRSAGSGEDSDLLVDESSAEDPGLAAAVKKVDDAWKGSLGEQDLECAEPADWMTICRRASLALVGNGLSLEEIRNLEKLPESQREAAHLENLLRDPRFHDYWAERWTRFFGWHRQWAVHHLSSPPLPVFGSPMCLLKTVLTIRWFAT